MKSPIISSVSKDSSGFTVIEIVVAIGITVMIFSMGIVVTFNFYKNNTLRAERDLVVFILGKARNKAMDNAYALPHGVHIAQSDYTIFRGSTYIAGDPSNEIIPGNSAIQKSGLNEVVFSQLSGDSNVENTITLSNGPQTQLISINNEGNIRW